MSPMIQSDDEPNDDGARRFVERIAAYQKAMQKLGYGQPPRSGEQELCSEGEIAEARARTEQKFAEVGDRLGRLGTRSSTRGRLPKSDQRRIDLDQRLADSLEEISVSLSNDLKLVVARLGTVETVLVKLDLLLHRLGELHRDVHRFHDSSLAGHGADPVSAPTATTEAATSVVGDSVRDGSDIPPEALDTSVEDSTATGAAATSQRPHPNPSTESGSDRR